MLGWRLPGWDALLALSLLLVVAMGLVYHLRDKKSRESFSIGDVFGKVKDGVNKVIDGGKKVVNSTVAMVKGGGDKVVPTYVGRQWDGQEWSCPWWTVETGLDNAQGCISSQYHNPTWRWDGAQWGWSCPNGTVPTGEEQWEKKCEVGWMGRQLLDGKWQCPAGTEDSGRGWDNSTWREAQKQCRRAGPYTLRVKAGAKWQCPPGSTDTGRSWGQQGEWNQCKWSGG